ncbi:phosphatidylinositol mannoside acyltransferase [[Mycobacterium] kokjensenii]|uniref:Phosphatidylinositol mannoside acyltransferase n=1 Tax=[Mycobacterium] kokjensenii TaxID=3064287 RepID=A0ABN9N6R7_9MYCO|nr:phosphatidylinositol mannoside acyltransferase [Mycolicibacter sp. MU0083]CAJ1499659.1 phosphatidylinositol mannoside acyltransferase [Mycolicibacter sp. MU0083]
MTLIPRGLRLPGLGRLEDWATDTGYAAGWMLVRAMPELVARNTFDAGALVAARGGGPDQLRRNLARVIGSAPEDVPAELMRASLASYARYWREAFRLPSMDLAALAGQLHDSIHGREHIDAALVAGRGAVMALPHSGNWDMAGVWLAQTHGRFTTVAERLKPESLYRRFLAFRESLGFEVLPLSGGPRPPFEILAERLTGNGLVCLLADRDLTRNGVPVDFFGEATRMPAGSAKLAVETGAALLPAHCRFDGAGWRVDIGAPLDCSSGDIGVITQVLADRFAEGIAAYPQDWHMLQPQWIADLPESRRAQLGER